MRVRNPGAQAVRRAEFPRLSGGLNLNELDYRLRADQSPNMKNLWWQDGILQCRDGQQYISDNVDRGTGYTCFEELFHGCGVFHIGNKLWYGTGSDDRMELHELCGGVPENRGCFFRYQEFLFYKNRGGYFRIGWDGETGFSCADMREQAFVPVISVNTDPETGGGSPYQPENRLTGRKTVRYNAKKETTVYQLPVSAIDGVVEVRVDGTPLTEERDYRVDREQGTVTFLEPPPVTDPPTNNTVEITFEKKNPQALAAVMDCNCAVTAGGDKNLCILLGGCPAQPNAVFWNANDQYAMNPGYFPMTTFNLAGDASDGVTGFGRQYGELILFQERSVGRLNFSLDEVDQRAVPLFTYTAINSRVGCDLPGTIRLVENNLVFCNKSRGVHMILSSSPAMENNIKCISGNVNGGRAGRVVTDRISGLLADVNADPEAVSWDDDSRFWLCANGHAYLWDYRVSTPANPSWFYMTELRPAGFFRSAERRTCHLDRGGRISKLGRYFNDYGNAIEKVYRFPALNFGDYGRLKNVVKVLLVTRSDTPTRIRIRYDSDYGTRYDQTDIATWEWTWDRMNLGGMILGYYSLKAPSYATVAVRRPGCSHVRHFSVTLSNQRASEDLAIVSAQVCYVFRGKER